MAAAMGKESESKQPTHEQPILDTGIAHGAPAKRPTPEQVDKIASKSYWKLPPPFTIDLGKVEVGRRTPWSFRIYYLGSGTAGPRIEAKLASLGPDPIGVAGVDLDAADCPLNAVDALVERLGATSDACPHGVPPVEINRFEVEGLQTPCDSLAVVALDANGRSGLRSGKHFERHLGDGAEAPQAADHPVMQ